MQEEAKTFLKRHSFWVVTTLVTFLLLAVLAMQYRSLRTLEQTLPAYRRDLMARCLTQVIGQIEDVYSGNASRVLSLPATAINAGRGGIIADTAESTCWMSAVAGVGGHFKQQQFRGANRYFLVVAVERNGEVRGETLFYNPITEKMEPDAQSPELRAINVACAPYLIYIKSRTVIQPTPVGIDRDANHPLVIKPVIDSEDRITAIAGFTSDQDWFRNQLLPETLTTTLPKLFPNEYKNAVVTLRLLDTNITYAAQADGKFKADGEVKVEDEVWQDSKDRPETLRVFAPFFTRNMLGLRMRNLSIGQWAQRSFIINLSLSLAMTLVLAGGLLMTLRVARRAMKLAQMKTDFVANVSHEFRTPLASIRVLAEMMKLGRVKDLAKVRDYGEYINLESQRLTRLVNNILDFSRIESAQETYQFLPVDLRDVIEETIKASSARFKENDHQIRLELPVGVTPVVKLDADAMLRALTNLIDNAIKYSSPGDGIILRLEFSESDARISIIDEGIGISREEQDKVFEKFYRISTGMVHDVKGTGLGLSIVKHIVEAHGGAVSVASEIGCGSKFTIHLPTENTLTALAREEWQPVNTGLRKATKG